MSTYLNFYLRVNNNFIPLGDYSRSCSVMYNVVNNDVPYEKIRAITSEDLKGYINKLTEAAGRIQKMKESDEKRIELIMNAANTPLEEKMEYVNEIQSNFMEMDELIKEYSFAADTLRVFLNMIDMFRYKDELYFDNDYNHYIYAGIEARGNMESIVE